MCDVGGPLSICEAMSEAERDRKVWGNPAMIVVDHDDECLSLSCTDAVSGRRIEFTQLSLVDSYDEVYLLAMAVDFTRTYRACQLYNNISMLFLFPVIDGKLSTGVIAIFNASCYG